MSQNHNILTISNIGVIGGGILVSHNADFVQLRGEHLA